MGRHNVNAVHINNKWASLHILDNEASSILKQVLLNNLLGGLHKEGRSRGTGLDPTSLEHQKGDGRIAVDVVLNIGI